MRQFALALISILGLASTSAAGNIDGVIEGWPADSLSSQRPAVVWLQGLQSPAPNKNGPVMMQRGGRFIPSFLVVVAGQSVSMPNEDEVAHNVYSTSPAKEFDLGYYAKGDLKTVTFDRPGIAELRCQLHDFMSAEILVVPNPYYARVAPDGSFHMSNAPAGKFILAFWGDGMASYNQEVIIPAGYRSVMVRLSPNTHSHE